MTSPQQDVQRYQAEQIAAAVAVVAAAGTAASLAGFSLANFTAWSRLIRLLFPLVSAQRQKSAWSAREFFDRERLRVTGLPRLDVPLVGYDMARFEKAMRPAYDMVVKQLAVARELNKQGLPAQKPKIDTTVSLLASREVSQAGREQLITLVEADNQFIQNLDEPAPREATHWARKQTGNETCAFCLMLVSRGPTYLSAESAGEGNQWHAGCDCIVVPVFDRADWPGRDEYLAALKTWNDAVPDKVDTEKKYRVRQKDGTYKMVTLKKGEARTREALINIRRDLVAQ